MWCTRPRRHPHAHTEHSPLLSTCVQEAVKNTQYDRLKDERGKAPGLLGWWPAKACTFVDNHDTGSTQQVGGRLVGGLAAGHRR